jgi:bile acid-coenzyme A ligase
VPELPLSAIPSHYAGILGDAATALVFGDRTVGWAELDARSDRRANWLREAGVRQGDFVLLSLRNEPAFFESTFAAWKVGAIPAPIPVNTPASQFAEIAALLKPAAIFAQDEACVPNVRVAVLTEPANLSGYDRPFSDPALAPNWKAILSGGSTGKPKIIVDGRAATFDVDAPVRLQKRLGRTLNPGPLYHNAPFLSSHQALFAGGTVVNMRRFDAEEALRLIEQHGIDWVNFVPTMMHRIWRLPPEVRNRYDLTSLQTVFHMASAMPTWLKRAWMEWIGPERIWELYAGTEGFGATVINGVDWLAHPGSVGRAIPGCRMKIVAPDGSECAAGETGEIYFVLDTDGKEPYRYLGGSSKPADGGWESYGDLGHVDEEGYLYLADRKTDLIIRGGANIYPAEIETAIDEHEHVNSSLVVGLPDEELGEIVHAIVHTNSTLPPEQLIGELVDHLRQRVSPNKLPASFELSSEPLRDDAGKARRSAIRQDRIARLAAGDSTWRIQRVRDPLSAST